MVILVLGMKAYVPSSIHLYRLDFNVSINVFIN